MRTRATQLGTGPRGGGAPLFRTAMLALLCLGLSACYESPGATHFQPGVYKGASDPLLEKERMPKQQEALRERFRMASKDR
ncbi:MAG: hypothetical protein P8X48_04730 [Acidiferrobacteraceae bacterium]|jgi:hypothetical protein